MSLISKEGLAKSQNEIVEEKKYYVAARSYGTDLESDPPKYVHQVNELGIKKLENIDWLDVGLEYRVRFENRDNDFRRSYDTVDSPVLSRTRAYFAVKNILDPLRFTLEIQDSRISNSKFANDNGDVNKLDVLQAYGELYFKKPLNYNRPLSIRAGRMSFETLDRRLVTRNGWRNTTNSFQGVKTTIGGKQQDWQLETFAFQPIDRFVDKADHVNKDQWFYGSTLNWQAWSEIVTLQPFYFRLDQRETETLLERKINSPGLRAYGIIGDSGFDYDLIAVYQFGRNGAQKHNARGYVSEIGYVLEKDWKPRLSLVYGYASGDKNSIDNKNQRFERLFGAGRTWSSNNYLQWENIESLKTRVEFQPSKKLKVDSSYGFYWLASASDRWNKAGLRDKKGNKGDAIGQEFDVRVRYKLTSNLESNIGYSHFQSGEFTKSVARGGSSDFVYLELTWSLF